MALDPEREKRRHVLYSAARVLSEAERTAFLDTACSQDRDLRAEIEVLLAAGVNAGEPHTHDHSGPPELGQVGPYRLVRPIGSGGMGVVYEAQDTRLERKVAVKILWGINAEEGSQERFRREARAASVLEHPNICSIYDVGETADGRFFIVMAYYAGETLRARLDDGALPVDEARRVAVGLARALKRAHDSGIVHRDVKPANVMLTRNGEVKLLDFGLAKLAGAASLTRSGGRPGTLAYMAPEQIRDESVDARADVWALGIVMYEMIAGRHPFRCEAPSATLRAILETEPVPLERARDEVPEALARVVDKALGKDLQQRYQTVGELLQDLETGVRPKVLPAPAGRSRFRRRRPIGIAAALVTVLAAALGLWRFSKVETLAERRSLAVLQFQNLTGSAELDWMRNGLAEMLVTDLSQSPEIEVPSSARVNQSLADHQLSESSTLRFDEIRKIADDVGARAVVRGSYARIGDSFRIDFKIEDAESGAILRSDRVEGGEASLFAMMDAVSASIRSGFEISRPARSPPTLAAATTSSLQAWQFYTEAVSLAREFKKDEALVLFERAVELDPGFALALVGLAGTHRDLGHDKLADEYLRRALTLAERLPLDDRFQVESSYYGSRWRTLDRAIDIYEQGLEVYPGNSAWRHNLARRYAFQERYQEALEQFDRLIEEDSDFSGTYFDDANVRTALSQFETGHAIVSQYASTHDDAWFAHHGLGWFLTEWGRLDEAEQSFDRSEALRPGDWSIPYARWRVAVLREDWQTADQYASEVAATDEPLARWRGAVSLARNALYRGKAREALQRFDQAVGAYSEPNAYSAIARCWKAELLLAVGEPARALEEAQMARIAGRDEWPEREALGVAALAYQALGLATEADARLAELGQLWDGSSSKNKVEKRHELYVRGLLELSRHDAKAVGTLREAASLLAPKGVEFHWHVYPIHVPVWVALGEAALAAGDTDAAIPWLERAATSGSEHLEHPVSFVRSLFLLASSYEEKGDDTKARELFERFSGLWPAGDLERAWQEEARRRVE